MVDHGATSSVKPAATGATPPAAHRKILMLIANEVVADGRVVRAGAALANTYDLEVLGWLRPERDNARVRQMVAALPFGVHLITLRWANRLPKNLLGYACRFIELFFRFLTQGLRRRSWAVYVHELQSLPVGYAIARLTGAKLVWDAHELYPDQDCNIVNLTPRSRRWSIRLQRFLMKRCDEIIACNRQRAEIMHAEYGAPFVPKVIRNVPPFTKANPGNSRLRDFVRQRNPNIRRIIAHTGALAGRGDDVVFPALARLPPDVGLVLIGYSRSTSSPKIRELMRTCGVEDRVFMHPQVPYAELQAHLADADLGFVLYANTCRNNYYCAPSKLYEYSMAGVPVLAVDFPPCREFLSKYECGRCFAWDSADDLAEKTRECLQSDDIYQRMRKEALRAARAVNWDNEGPRLVEVFNQLAKKR